MPAGETLPRHAFYWHVQRPCLYLADMVDVGMDLTVGRGRSGEWHLARRLRKQNGAAERVLQRDAEAAGRSATG